MLVRLRSFALGLALCAVGSSASAAAITFAVADPSFIDLVGTDYHLASGSALTYTNGGLTTQYQTDTAGTVLDTARLGATPSFSALSPAQFGFPIGYTSFRRQGGGQFTDFNLAAANDIGSTTVFDFIQVLNGATVVGAGSVHLNPTVESITISGNGTLFTEVDVYAFFGGTTPSFEPNTTDFNATVSAGGRPFGPDVPPGAAVPEPASWALLILGFGSVGALLRRRYAVSYAPFPAPVGR